ncbi:MAG: hypothetical protein EPN49_02420 [Rhodanobacter sp.]|nr:MAG: hypothetical protein EPN49_02420 [Rhodanobacter sp.]
MKLPLALLAPWRFNLTGTRWLALGLVLLAVFGAAGWACFMHTANWWVGSAAIAGVFEAMLWNSVFSYMVLPAIDAHQLRLPGMQRSLFVGWAFYGVLSLLLPAIGIGLWVGKVAVIAVFVGLFCLAGLLWALLPRYLGIVVYAPFYAAAVHARSLLSLGHSGFLIWALPLALLLLLLAMARVHRLVVASEPYVSGRHGPPVLRIGRGIGGAFAAGRGRYGSRAIAARPDWMQARASLRGCGPGHPVASLRLALGGSLMPTSVMGWLHRKMAMLAIIFAVCGFMLWQTLGRAFQGSPTIDRHTSQLLVLSMLGGFVSASMVFNCGIELLQRWRKSSAELPLLALLPGLRSGGFDVKRHLLWAILLPPLRIQLVLMAVLLALATSLHVDTSMKFYVLASQASATVALVAYTLFVTGGQTAGRWANLGIGLFWGVLLTFPLFVSGLDLHPANLAMTRLTVLFDAGWILLIALLAWLGRRGWRGLQQRPHPFLPN